MRRAAPAATRRAAAVYKVRRAVPERLRVVPERLGVGRHGGDPAVARRARVLAALAVTIVSSAAVFAGVRAGLRGYGPFQLVALRFIMASLVLLALARPLGVRLPRRRDLPALLALGACGIGVYQVALAVGEQHVSASVASMVVASQTIVVAGLATAVLGERLTRLGWLGVVVGFGGVAIISVNGGGGLHVDLQVLWPLGAALASSLYFVFEKPLLRRYSAVEMTTWCIWVGTIVVLPFAVGLPAQIAAAPWGATAAVVFLAIVPGVLAYLTWTYVLARAPATLAVNALCLIPPLAVVTAYLWLGERPTGLELLGGLITVAGVALVGLRGAPARRRPAGALARRRARG